MFIKFQIYENYKDLEHILTINFLLYNLVQKQLTRPEVWVECILVYYKLQGSS